MAQDPRSLLEAQRSRCLGDADCRERVARHGLPGFLELFRAYDCQLVCGSAKLFGSMLFAEELQLDIDSV